MPLNKLNYGEIRRRGWLAIIPLFIPVAIRVLQAEADPPFSMELERWFDMDAYTHRYQDLG